MHYTLGLYHKKSKTFFMADTFWNYPKESTPNLHTVVGASEEETKRSLKQHICPKMSSTTLPGGNLPEVKPNFGTKAWKFGMDKIYLQFYKNFMVGRSGERREKYNKIVNKVLSWDIDVIAPCHGDVIRGEKTCRHVLKTHFL